MRLFALALISIALAGCSGGKPNAAGEGSPAAASERSGPVTWNATSGAFELGGRPLATAKLWTFDDSTEGFTAIGAELTPDPKGGLVWPVVNPMIRSPKGLNVDGARYPLVIVRLTRTRAGEQWDAALYYSTQTHGETGQYFAKPVNNTPPSMNETVTLVYDMSRLVMGGQDWTTSSIDQIRLDIEDKAGGRFVIRQIAIAENPTPDAFAPPPAPPPAPATAPPAAPTQGASPAP